MILKYLISRIMGTERSCERREFAFLTLNRKVHLLTKRKERESSVFMREK
jgi:hypothetical protein